MQSMLQNQTANHAKSSKLRWVVAIVVLSVLPLWLLFVNVILVRSWWRHQVEMQRIVIPIPFDSAGWQAGDGHVRAQMADDLIANHLLGKSLYEVAALLGTPHDPNKKFQSSDYARGNGRYVLEYGIGPWLSMERIRIDFNTNYATRSPPIAFDARKVSDGGEVGPLFVVIFVGVIVIVAGLGMIFAIVMTFVGLQLLRKQSHQPQVLYVSFTGVLGAVATALFVLWMGTGMSLMSGWLAYSTGAVAGFGWAAATGAIIMVLVMKIVFTMRLPR